MNISIVIPTYNRDEILVDTIKSIIREIERFGQENIKELVIVDQSINHSKKVSSFIKDCRKLSYFSYIYEKTASLPNARNIGLSHVTGDIVLFLDDDVVLSKGFFSNLLDGYKNENICSVVGGVTIINKDKSNILLENQSYLKKIIRKLLCIIIGGGKPLFISKTGLVLSNIKAKKETLVDMGIGCNMSFRRRIFDEIGLFDTNYIGNALREETDFFVRIKKAKENVLFKPNMHLFHVMANTGGCRNDINEKYWQLYFYNQCYFYIKNFGFSKTRIKFILIFDYIKCKKKGFQVSSLLNEAYGKAWNKCQMLSHSFQQLS